MAHFGVPPADVSPEVRGVAFKTLSGTDTSQESYAAANLGQATGSDHSWVRRLAAAATVSAADRPKQRVVHAPSRHRWWDPGRHVQRAVVAGLARLFVR